MDIDVEGEKKRENPIPVLVLITYRPSDQTLTLVVGYYCPRCSLNSNGQRTSQRLGRHPLRMKCRELAPLRKGEPAACLKLEI